MRDQHEIRCSGFTLETNLYSMMIVSLSTLDNLCLAMSMMGLAYSYSTLQFPSWKKYEATRKCCASNIRGFTIYCALATSIQSLSWHQITLTRIHQEPGPSVHETPC